MPSNVSPLLSTAGITVVYIYLGIYKNPVLEELKFTYYSTYILEKERYFCPFYELGLGELNVYFSHTRIRTIQYGLLTYVLYLD